MENYNPIAWHEKIYLLHDYRIYNQMYDSEAEKYRLEQTMQYHMEQWLIETQDEFENMLNRKE